MAETQADAMNRARTELAGDSGKDLTVCWGCGAFHWVSSGRCPYCNAALTHQCWTTRDNKPAATHANYAKAYQRRAQHLREHAAICEGKAADHLAVIAEDDK